MNLKGIDELKRYFKLLSGDEKKRFFILAKDYVDRAYKDYINVLNDIEKGFAESASRHFLCHERFYVVSGKHFFSRVFMDYVFKNRKRKISLKRQDEERSWFNHDLERANFINQTIKYLELEQYGAKRN